MIADKTRATGNQKIHGGIMGSRDSGSKFQIGTQRPQNQFPFPDSSPELDKTVTIA
jgi:hypothetical protein